MIVKNYADLQQCLSWLDRQTHVAYDLETDGLNPRKNRVIGIAISNATEGFYIVHSHLADGIFQEFISKKMLAPLWAKLRTKKLITFNGSFDLRMTLGYFGVDLCDALWSEVQLARHTNNENDTPWVKLKELARQHFGDTATNEQQDLITSIIANGGEAGHVWLGDLNLVGKYAIQDALLTYKLNDIYIKSLSDQGLAEFYFDLEVMSFYKHVLIYMEYYGFHVDVDLLQKTQAQISADIERLEQQIREKIQPYMYEFDQWFLSKTFVPKASGEFAQQAAKFYGVDLPLTKNGAFSFAEKPMSKLPDSVFKRFMAGQERLPDEDIVAIQREMRGNDQAFNLKSKHHLKRIFFDHLKEAPLSFTETTREPQIDDEFLHSIIDKYEFVPLLMDYNKLNKIKSTYIDRFLEDQEDGVYYARWAQHTTSTGRLSGNAQQLPRRKEESEQRPLPLKYTNMIRDFIIAPEGYKLVGADYASLEVVIFADDAGDEPLLDIIRKDLDFYSGMAIQMKMVESGLYSADKTAANYLKKHRPDIRQGVKPIGLGIRYGMEDFKLSKTLNISQAEARKLIRNYFESFPKLKTRMDELKQQSITQGFVKSKFGRICHLVWAKKLYAAHGKILEDSLKLWEKYNESPSRYKEMKFLKGKYLSDIRAALNFPIQSAAASIVMRASVAMSKEFKAKGLDAKVIMNIHDEANVLCADKDVEAVSEIIQRTMETTTLLSVPLKAEPQVGQRYSELK